MPGMTAYIGLANIGQPKEGETVVVSAASGAVGAVAGQLAKRQGARVVGIAGGADKCRYVKDELGFDAALDHRGPDLGAALDEACPKGIDVYFENVGGAVQHAVFPRLNDFGRMIMCGMISEYNDTTPRPGPNLMSVVRKRLTHPGLHRQRRLAALWRVPRRGSAAGQERSAADTAKTSSRGSTTRRRPSSACCRERISASLLVRLSADPTR